MKKHQFGLNFVFIVLSVIIILPLLIVLSTSFTTEMALSRNGYGLFIEEFTLDAYKAVFEDPKSIMDAYGVTFIFSVVSMFLSVLFTALIAYPLSRSIMKFRKTISFYLYFTMLFSGGLVPTYILITQYLHLGDSIWVYILPGMISPWYAFMMRTFFSGIPEAMIESAYIDGADEYRIFFTFILPLSKPVLATVALQVFLLKWNDWYTCMLYINKDSLTSLQYLLQRIMQNINALRDDPTNMQLMESIPTETTRMAMAIVVAGPVLFAFPFFQKYFVKGMTVGSVKG